MIAPDFQTAVEKLAELIEGARSVVPFTGAGISTECGIPDFRSPGGLWTKHAPIPFDQFLTSRHARDETWQRRFAMDEVLSGAKPGRGHRALASLHRAGKVPGVVTQNIDNLHQVSGIPHAAVCELHGNTSYVACLDCGKHYTLKWVRDSFDQSGHAPECVECNGFIKTATIAFGQSMPQTAMQQAEQLTMSADVFMAIGSSLVVWPAAGFPLMAKRNGAALVILNREPTEFDDLADLVIHHDIGDVLTRFISQ